MIDQSSSCTHTGIHTQPHTFTANNISTCAFLFHTPYKLLSGVHAPCAVVDVITGKWGTSYLCAWCECGIQNPRRTGEGKRRAVEDSFCLRCTIRVARYSFTSSWVFLACASCDNFSLLSSCDTSLLLLLLLLPIPGNWICLIFFFLEDPIGCDSIAYNSSAANCRRATSEIAFLLFARLSFTRIKFIFLLQIEAQLLFC